VQAINAIIAI